MVLPRLKAGGNVPQKIWIYRQNFLQQFLPSPCIWSVHCFPKQSIVFRKRKRPICQLMIDLPIIWFYTRSFKLLKYGCF